ncbi:TraR/DksA family transcriptional regulator [Kangiella sediminilitoris]|uniref:Transcriptional regulator, TraR/DksA family n=1 Tax=Kangiella sediminilitoris TaxID=1144748 RepID=A0A1B3BCT7_9GAMM|nr:TraR/DksA C4-type zinc finger protein [Kangiella sediminilitoris]AOE50634.1 Transcriptional regulator, TraR/DksA family [Kangiella sediminilitoris]
MNKKQLRHYTEKLHQLETELMDYLGLTSEAGQAVELDQARQGRVSRGDAMQQQAMVNASHVRDQKHLLAVRNALKRVASGDYGFCLECGETIAPERLDIAPDTELCLDCRALQEKREGLLG